MNKKIKYIIYVIIFILIIVGINIGYDFLKNSIQKQENNLTTQNSKTKLKLATDITVYNENNEAINLSSFKGKPIVINFWTTWCVYCKTEMQYFEKLYQQLKEDVTFIMLNVTIEDDKQEVEKYIKEQGYTFPVYYDTDGTAMYSYRITGYPVTVFIDKDFQINRTHQGMITQENLQKYIDNIK